MFDWIDKNKHKDTLGIMTLKLLYIIGKNDIANAIIILFTGIAIPIAFDSKKFLLFWIILIFTVCWIVFNIICKRFKDRKHQQQELAYDVLKNQSSLINTLNIEIKSNPQWKTKSLKTMSEIVCEKIQHMFKDILNCDTRVSVEYIFNKKGSIDKGRNNRYVKMAGRRSSDRDTCKKAVLLESRNKYYSYRVFTENKSGINILSDEDINGANTLWYHNPSHQHKDKIRRYLGIAVSVTDDNKVDYILQIDCLDDVQIGKNSDEKDIKVFINKYLNTYINCINLAYLLNLNRNKEITEV